MAVITVPARIDIIISVPASCPSPPLDNSKARTSDRTLPSNPPSSDTPWQKALVPRAYRFFHSTSEKSTIAKTVPRVTVGPPSSLSLSSFSFFSFSVSFPRGSHKSRRPTHAVRFPISFSRSYVFQVGSISTCLAILCEYSGRTDLLTIQTTLSIFQCTLTLESDDNYSTITRAARARVRFSGSILAITI